MMKPSLFRKLSIIILIVDIVIILYLVGLFKGIYDYVS
jgi:hypothetical protein